MPMNPNVIYSITQVSTNVTAQPGDTLLVTTGTNDIVVELPEAYTSGPTSVIVRKIDAAGTGTVTIKTSDGAEINGVAGTTGLVLAASAVSGAHLVLDTDVTPNAWWQIA